MKTKILIIFLNFNDFIDRHYLDIYNSDSHANCLYLSQKLQQMSRSILFIAIISSILFINYYANPPDGYTGAPINDEYSCTICHQISSISPYGYSEVKGFPSIILPGQDYNIEVVVKSDDSRAKYTNFQLMVVDKDKSVGKLSKSLQNVNISKYKNREYAESKPAIKIKNGYASFEFNWKAPNTGDNKILTLYYTTIIANGDGSFAGDRVFESKAIGVIGSSLDISIEDQQNNLCPDDSSAFVKITAEGGQAPYSFLWSNNESSQEIYNLKSGEYFVTVTDKNGLLGVKTIKITNPKKLEISSIIKQDIDSGHKGSISVSVTGGSGQYSYRWFKNDEVFSTDSNINNLDKGCYKVEVKDSCESIVDSTICLMDFSAVIDNDFNDILSIYPNPVSDVLVLKCDKGHQERYKIIDVHGKIVMKSNRNRIDVSVLSPGLYFLVLESKDYRIVKRFILER